MERMYQEYKDIAEFRIVYISEAHAIDDPRPNPFAELKGIYEHKDSGQRCSTAEMMMQEENITISCIIDDMDNNVSVAYKALPDRLYVVRKDGRLAVAAEKGPRGLGPALEETWVWLAEYRKTDNSRDSSKTK